MIHVSGLQDIEFFCLIIKLKLKPATLSKFFNRKKVADHSGIRILDGQFLDIFWNCLPKISDFFEIFDHCDENFRKKTLAATGIRTINP
mgnify:CR=1 FL=1